MSVIKEFRDFAVRGNVIDLAVGVIIGGAFGKIVSSAVNDVLMPPVGALIGKVNFSDLFVSLSGGEYKSLAEAKAAGAATVNYGVFMNTLLDFTITAFVMFMIIKQFNRVKEELAKKEAPAVSAAPTEKECPACFSKIHIKATRCPHCTTELKA